MNIYGYFLLTSFGVFMLLLIIMELYESRVIDKILTRLNVDYSKQVGVFDQLKKARAVQELGPAFVKEGRNMEVLFRSTVGLFLFTALMFIIGAAFSF